MIVVIAKSEKNILNDINEILSEIRQSLKENEIAQEICKEQGFDIDIIDGIPIEFEEDLDASAKTVDSKIRLSTSLLDEEFEIIMRYAIHELVHALQHMRLDNFESYDDLDYLDRPDELEAFQFQIAYDAQERGEDEAIDYVEDLIEYHEIPEDDKLSKKEELLEKI